MAVKARYSELPGRSGSQLKDRLYFTAAKRCQLERSGAAYELFRERVEVKRNACASRNPRVQDT